MNPLSVHIKLFSVATFIMFNIIIFFKIWVIYGILSRSIKNIIFKVTFHPYNIVCVRTLPLSVFVTKCNNFKLIRKIFFDC